MKTMKEQLADARTVKKYWESSIPDGRWFRLTDAQALTWAHAHSEEVIHKVIDKTARAVTALLQQLIGEGSLPAAVPAQWWADRLLKTAAQTAPAQEATR